MAPSDITDPKLAAAEARRLREILEATTYSVQARMQSVVQNETSIEQIE